ncbi:MAG: type II secretion system major pseudopilin GspG [Verrucomicrobiota bacterium]
MKVRLPASAPARAFTLIEMVLVLAIVALLVGASSVALVGILGSAKEQTAEKNILQIETALQNYQLDNRRLPTESQGLKALVEKPTSQPAPKRWKQYIDPLPLDPWDQDYKYRLPAKRSKKDYDVFSLGKDGQEGTEDDIGNWSD